GVPDLGLEPALDMPVPVSSPAPISQTVWDSSRVSRDIGKLVPATTVVAQAAGMAVAPPPGASAPGTATAGIGVAVGVATDEGPTHAPTNGAPPTIEPLPLPLPIRPPPREWQLPEVELLDEEMEQGEATALDHQRNIRIIEEKLRSFQIPAVV